MMTIYDELTGEIKRSVDAPPDQEAIQALPGESIIRGFWGSDEYYVVNGEAVVRPFMEIKVSKLSVIANGVDSCTFSALPDDCEVFVDDVHYQVLDNVFELSLVLQGEYVVRAKKFPFVDEEWIIEGIA